MEVHFPGRRSISELFQEIWDFRHNFMDRYATSVQIKSATMHITFCDDRGRVVTLRNEHGKRLNSYISAGAYHCAADFYEAQQLDPKITTIEDVRAPAQPLNNAMPSAY